MRCWKTYHAILEALRPSSAALCGILEVAYIHHQLVRRVQLELLTVSERRQHVDDIGARQYLIIGSGRSGTRGVNTRPLRPTAPCAVAADLGASAPSASSARLRTAAAVMLRSLRRNVGVTQRSRRLKVVVLQMYTDVVRGA